MNAMLRILAWVLALALVALPVVAVVQGWIGAERWPLRTLRVIGDLAWVEDAALREAVLPHAQRGFFAVDLTAAQAAVSTLPWVEQAEVRKRWPDVLEVRVSEHRPFARWGDDRLLSEQGRLFPAAGTTPPDGLPWFDGPEARVPDVVALYNESRALFTAVGDDVERIAVDSRGSWSMRLASGTEVVIGGQQARPRIERFARLLPRLLHERAERLQRADLRYTNGFALTWGEATTAGSDGSAAVATTRQPLAASTRVSRATAPLHALAQLLRPGPAFSRSMFSPFISGSTA
ncbi:FtsQ-type POTRA domain-containing protein [Luteimonas yindakuii]|uniref:Cell division protein FtsQ n=1 Tax=Luteimonas yindakuii TaxID=2565782 RepID=A0A4Z1R5S3_9GAMM|nr:cell division protein FtsQ/DivIB [Luteimonas yindakuii]TKS54800.1 FtsQ-type POTRA domain-containing protein [Luteimonas yindakuii]